MRSGSATHRSRTGRCPPCAASSASSSTSLPWYTCPSRPRAYGFVGRRARVAIYSVESNNELFDLINQDPLFRYLEREVVPLATNDQLRELYRSIIDADG